MNIYQIVPTLNWGDAIGNEVLAMNTLIQEMGYNTCIYVDTANVSTVNMRLVREINVSYEDIVIFHLSIGTYIDEIFENLKCKKIIVYHNMTPSHFFERCSKKMVKVLSEGIEHVIRLKECCDLVLADSEYNRLELIKLGYESRKIRVLPIILELSQFNQLYDQKIYKKYKDGYVNILFTGRIAPNKKHEDIIKAFYKYKTQYNHKSRLILAGSFNGMEKYYAKLKGFVKSLKLKDVIFTGHIPFEQLLAYYRVADLFLCMSEHEGFCVPLLEAMHFDIPIMAYDSTAIPYTLNSTGMVFKEKNYKDIAYKIEQLMNNRELIEEITRKQKKHLKSMEYEKTSKLFIKYLEEFIEKNNK